MKNLTKNICFGKTHKVGIMSGILQIINSLIIALSLHFVDKL